MDLYEFTRYVAALAEQTKNSTREALSRVYTYKNPIDNSVKTMLVYYGTKVSSQQKQISADVVRDFMRLIRVYSAYEAVLIVDAPISSTGNAELSALKLMKWQVFQDCDLTFDPTEHIDVPRHIRLSKEETAIKLKELKTDLSKLPLIKSTDPIVRFYGWEIGDVIKVERDDTAASILATKSINYRVVIDAPAKKS
jgi:DNA-directed RNA polymerase subunit H (RpoH/RPB5)